MSTKSVSRVCIWEGLAVVCVLFNLVAHPLTLWTVLGIAALVSQVLVVIDDYNPDSVLAEHGVLINVVAVLLVVTYLIGLLVGPYGLHSP